ncbi:hypothetical protein [Sinorhizobium meliloti]|uniref:hypothetical protein n=1 Tax=Rhizobium meliloti TaxID=382 RepID=UPI000FD9A684|nr:hypothetical protein [Sinorhizobium meliloti]RVL05653.1 hypothetical protein CN152_03365 [Sinorhizobium meliloti]RVN49957.1 hypothetical protein CN113_06950 [Sinorhizobium meliloti]
MPSIPDEFVPLRTRGPQAAPEPEADPTVLQTLGAAGVAANMPYRAWRYNANRENVEIDPAYNPFEDINGTKYATDPQRFAYSRNRDETQAIMREWDQDDEAKGTLARSGWGGTVATFGMGMADPTIALPLLKVFSGATAGVNALRLGADVALTGAVGSAISETGMMATSPEMTGREFATNVGTATVLSGILGAGAGALLSRSSRLAIEAKLHQDRIAWGDDLSPAPQPQAAGAAASDTRNVELVKTPLDKLPGGDPLGRLSPTRRVLNSPLQSARRALVDLAETPYLFEGNAEGRAVTKGPALDRLMKLQIRQARVGFSDVLEGAVARYRLGQDDANIVQRAMMGIEDIRGATGGKLSRQEFKTAIDEALRNGDTHPIAEVAEVAGWVRNNVLNPWRDRAIKAGLLPEGVEPETAASYMMRSWNKEKLTAQRPEAQNRIADWLTSEQSRKAAIQETLTDLGQKLDDAEDRIVKLERKAKGGSPEHVAARAEADVLRGQIETQLSSWKGKSANEALSAIKARDKGGPRAPDADRLTSADKSVSAALRKIIAGDRNLSRAELHSRAGEIIDRILGSPDGRLPYDDASAPSPGAPAGDARGPLASREFMIPDAMIRDFLDTDIERTLHRFLDTIVPDVLLTERFGDVDMLETFRKLRDEHDALAGAAKTEKERIKLKARYDATVADLAAVRDRIRGTYGNTTDPRMRAWGRTAANVQKVNQLTDMGGVVLSSVPDLAGAIFHYGFAGPLRHQMNPMMRLFGSKDAKNLSREAKQELRALGIGVETVLQSRNAAISDIFDMYAPTTRTDRVLDKASNAYFIANLLSPWTDAMQRISGTTAMDRFSKSIEAAVAGKASKSQTRKLAEAGIDSTMTGRIWKEMNAAGGSNVVDGVRLSNSGTWKDTGARDAWEGAIARDVDMMVISPGQEKSLLPSRNPAVALLLQYKTFVMSASERILFRGLQARDAQVAQGFVAAVVLGMVGEYAYSLASGRDTPNTLPDWIKAGMSRSGVFGWIEEANAIGSKWTGGTTDLYQAIGAEAQGSRYQSREKLGILLGPTANKLEGVVRAGANAINGEWGDADTRRMRRLVAGQNLFYLRQLFDKIGEE